MKKQGIIIALVIVLLLAIGGGVAFFIISNNDEDKDDDRDNKSTSEKMDDDDDEYYDEDNEYSDDEDDEYYDDDEENDDDDAYSSLSNQAKDMFNSKFESYEGSAKGTDVRALIQTVISSNQEYEGEREVTVEMDDEDYSLSSELNTLRSEIVTSNKYDVSFEYDDDGYIDTVIIE